MPRVDSASEREIVENRRDLRPITSQVTWAVLGLVIERPGYGYELAQRFEEGYGSVLPLHTYSHVYEALKSLERRGLLEATKVPGSQSSRGGSGEKAGYRATEQGKIAYRAWLLTRLEAADRDWMLVARLLGVLAAEPDKAWRSSRITGVCSLLKPQERWCQVCMIDAGISIMPRVWSSG
jgi:DNA-binding PadR family transcriptional regulator